MNYLMICLILLLWVIMGFLSFIIDSKRTFRTYFDLGEFILYIAIGPIAICVLTCMIICEKFQDFMTELL